MHITLGVKKLVQEWIAATFVRHNEMVPTLVVVAIPDLQRRIQEYVNDVI